MFRSVFLLGLGLVLGVPQASAASESAVDLAGVLVRDAQWGRARSVMEQIQPDELQEDRGRYHMLQGLILLHEESFEASVASFQQALADSEEDDEILPLIHLGLAEAQVGTAAFSEALASLAKSGELAKNNWKGFRVGVEAYLGLAKMEAAFSLANEGIQSFPDAHELHLLALDMLLELGAFRQAQEQALGLVLDGPQDSVPTLLAVRRLKDAGALAEAVAVLDAARHRWRGEPRLWILQAAVEVEREHPGMAAKLLQVVAWEDPEYAVEAAELYRQAGLQERALAVNAVALDGAEKVRQRFGLLLELSRFEAALSLRNRLQREQVLGEDAVLYGLAYACFKTGRFEEAHSTLDPIQDPDVFRQATALRGAIDRCAQTQQCL